MSHQRRMTFTSLMLLGSLGATAPAALAQAPQAPGLAAQQGAPPHGAPEEAEAFPIFAIASVEILRSAHAPVLDVVVVHGLASSEGWGNGELVPLSRGTPQDGVLDLIFVAEPPPESAAPTGYTPIQAVLALSPRHPFTAVRVRSATNSLQLHSFPGQATTKAPAEPCEHCLGKQFVARGAAAPAGVAAADIVHEESLPPKTRIIRPADGIGDMRPNPNRFTILLGTDNRIIDAVWE